MSAFVRKGDFWSGLAMAALGAYVVSQSLRWDYMGEDGPGAGFFPLWYGGLMIVLSLLLVLGAVLKADPAAESKRINWPELRRVGACWGAFVACIALLQPLGFILSFATDDVVHRQRPVPQATEDRDCHGGHCPAGVLRGIRLGARHLVADRPCSERRWTRSAVCCRGSTSH